MPEGRAPQQAMSMDEAVQLAEAYQDQLETLEHQRQTLSSVETECKNTRTALDGLKDSPKEDVMVPVGAGTFVHATLKDVQNVVTPIGAGVHVGMPVDEARQMLEERANDARKAREELESTIQRIQTQLEELVGRIRAAQQQAQGQMQGLGGLGGAAGPPGGQPRPAEDEDE